MKLLDKEGQEVDKIDFGVVEVGSQKTVEFSLLNNEGTYVEGITITLEDRLEKSEVAISEYQQNLSDKGISHFNFTWSPTLQVKRGLKIGFIVKYKRIWG